ncbi:hypothetical protein V7128_01195 [Neobacillus vireti]|uniref:hypothetical protein n=1 Tax=Neobacillus vireti TaxID=220686 RepID=UPI002FFFF4E2
MEEQAKEQILELDAEQLEELMSGSDKLPPMEIPFEFYDDKQFYQGIKDTSHIAGVITALLNTGVSESFVLDYLLSKDTIAHNIEVAKINKETNVEVAKQAKLKQDQFEL